jgi:endonuclease YncB( thermonuclease family)
VLVRPSRLILRIRFKHAAACLLIAYELLLCIDSVASDDGKFAGKVLSIKDGDSIIVMHKDGPEELRLNGIDAQKQINHTETRLLKRRQPCVLTKK